MLDVIDRVPYQTLVATLFRTHRITAWSTCTTTLST
jgi:hypothetical protein